mmetsp:Transcript_15080/g.32949  ORF Transcript_15080/g.32949 Transcript_15080/m.32949 type:complete len:705 (+) Transcript_15080:227-2341(+)|eukprot:CAMPEP_0168743790 /NCGR_PEP_ID=MMETSP0724-20121128/13759_1 /TAXON_ID=265536 /ORGANISM="Amphiprora sp., Strain CCMP467" /LENGTH=704 /DNA_ID=CAMNT_0008791433 /DNA_START=122 /DNA_END=2236 /DNA_ORIENTATION=-
MARYAYDDGDEPPQRHYLLPATNDVEVPTQVRFEDNGYNNKNNDGDQEARDDETSAISSLPIFSLPSDNHNDDEHPKNHPDISPVTFGLPTPPRHPGGAVYHMSTFQTPPRRQLPQQQQQPYRDVFQEEYDATRHNEGFSYGNQHRNNNSYHQQQQQNRLFPSRPRRNQIQPNTMEQPQQPLEYDDKGYHIRNFEEYQQRNRNSNRSNYRVQQQQQQEPTFEKVDDNKGDQEQQSENEPAGDDTSYYTFMGLGKCSLMGLMVTSCIVGLGLSLAALGAVMLWDQDVVSSVASFMGDSSSETMSPTPSPVTTATTTNTDTATTTTTTTAPSPLGVTIWQEYRGVTNGMGFGSKVAIRDNWVAIAAELNNSVTAYEQDLVSGVWSTSPPLYGGGLGMDIHLGMTTQSKDGPQQPFLVVGAPQSGSGGSVSFYSYATGEWAMQGGALQAAGVDAASSKFGTSVAATDRLTVVVGAPEYGADNVGRVFTFQLVSTPLSFSAQQVVRGTLTGSNATESRFGSDLDVSESGDRLVVGEPGTSSATIYRRQGLDQSWELEFTLQLSDAGDLGSSVIFLSSDVVVVGAPSANENAGLVVAFRRIPTATINDQNPTWEEIGRIEGAVGERIGRKGTVSGALDPSSGAPQVVVSTTTGSVRRYDWIGDQLFAERFEDKAQGSVSSVDVAADADGFVVLTGYKAQDFVALYGVVD